MVNEKKIQELEKRINAPNYSESLTENKNSKPDIGTLKKLAKQIRKTVEDYPIETSAHSYTGNRP